LGGAGSALYVGAGYANILDWNPFEGDRILVDANLIQFYTLQIGDFGAGSSALDTEILFNGDRVGVAADSAALVLFLSTSIILTPV
jgi:hypothetical protein